MKTDKITLFRYVITNSHSMLKIKIQFFICLHNVEVVFELSQKVKQSNSSKSANIDFLQTPDNLLTYIFFSGALDTTKIHVVPKHSINESAMRKAPMKVLNLPFEATFRLQVFL